MTKSNKNRKKKPQKKKLFGFPNEMYKKGLARGRFVERFTKKKGRR